jgi:hypothetical protein
MKRSLLALSLAVALGTVPVHATDTTLAATPDAATPDTTASDGTADDSVTRAQQAS